RIRDTSEAGRVPHERPRQVLVLPRADVLVDAHARFRIGLGATGGVQLFHLRGLEADAVHAFRRLGAGEVRQRDIRVRTVRATAVEDVPLGAVHQLVEGRDIDEAQLDLDAGI